MNKEELLAALDAACVVVYLDTLEQEPDDPKLYSVKTDQAEGLNKIAGGETVSFKVLAEGTDQERAFVLSGWPKLPADKNEKGMAYLAGKVESNEIEGFVLDEERTRSDLGRFSFFICTVWEPVGDDSVSEKLWRVAENSQGDVYHRIII